MIHKLYLQKLGGAIVDVSSVFGLVLQSAPLELGVKVKAPAKRSWYDEDGDDEFIPGALNVESKEVEYRLSYKGVAGSANAAFIGLSEYLTGADGDGAVFSVWDDWSRVGWLQCRFEEMKISGTPYRNWDDALEADSDIVTMSVKIKVLTPRERVSPLNE